MVEVLVEGWSTIDAASSPERRLSTSTVAAASGYSVQQVRDLERLGVIPPARRADNGYREFSPVHLLALRAYRDLAAAVGPVAARRALREIRTLPLEAAAALVSSFHVTLAKERDVALEAQQALLAIRREAWHDEAAPREDTMTITELAGALGVRTSTLRFWEEAGLVAPERVTTLAARRYPPGAVREARITAALRAAGYRIPDVRRTIGAIRELRDLDDPLEALQARLDDIAARTLALLRAGADVPKLVEEGRGVRT